MSQITLPFSGLTNATAERSRRAAENAAPAVNRRQREVLDFLASCGAAGATDNAVIAWVVSRGGSPNGPRARRIELARAGLVEAAGERDGSTVWVLTDAGREALETGDV